MIKFYYLNLKEFRRFFCSIIIEHLRMEITPNYAKLHQCIECDFKCCKKVDWERHISTAKHKNRTKSNILEQKNAKKRHLCKCCGKSYNARNSLWYHQQKCVINNYKNIDEKDNPTDKELIMMLIKENSELKHMVLDVCQKIQPITNTINSHNVNSNN